MTDGMARIRQGTRQRLDEEARAGIPARRVPTHYYKVLFDPAKMKVIAFLMPHQRIVTADLKLFLSSVDAIELISGLNFLTGLEDSLEEEIESIVPTQMW